MKTKRIIDLAIFALHPIYYQVPIFRYVEKLGKGLSLKVCTFFGDDLLVKPAFFKEVSTIHQLVMSDLLEGYSHEFLENLAREKRGGFFSRINIKFFFRVLRGDFGCVLVHGYETFSSWLIAVAAFLSGTKLIWRGEVTLEGKEVGLKTFLKSVIVRFYFKFPDVVLYSCQGNQAFLLARGVRPEKMMPLPCAVDNHMHRQYVSENIQARKALREKMGFKEEEVVIIFPARFTPRKRPADLIEAVSRSRLKESVKILFVGDGPERSRLEALAAKYHVHALFTGFVQPLEVRQYYLASDIYAVLSDYDPSPKALNEAMNYKLPVICSSHAGTCRDLVEHEVNGFIVEPGDIESITSCIDTLAGNRDLRIKMGQMSANIVEGFTIDKDARNIIAAMTMG